MDVILLERVSKLGAMGQVVKVKDGYARNFLLRRGKALRATDANKAKFERVTPMLEQVLDVALPDAGFYLWAGVPGGDDLGFALKLLAQYNVAVLPGSLLARAAHGSNPGAGRIRLALVAGVDECVEAAERIASFTRTYI